MPSIVGPPHFKINFIIPVNLIFFEASNLTSPLHILSQLKYLVFHTPNEILETFDYENSCGHLYFVMFYTTNIVWTLVIENNSKQT